MSDLISALTPPPVTLPTLPTLPGTGGSSGGGINSLISGILGKDNINTQNSGANATVSGQSSAQNVDGTTTQNNTQQIGTVNQTKGTTSTNAGGVTSTLGAGAVGDLTTALDTASSKFTPADLSSLQDTLSRSTSSSLDLATQAGNKALGANAALDSSSSAIVAAARSTLDQQLRAQKTKLAQGAGTSFNSVVQDAFARDQGLADVQLAGLQASLMQTNRAQATQEMATAITSLNNVSGTILATVGQVPALAAGVDATRAASVTALANALKGAQTSTSENTTSAQDTRNETQQTINAITGTTQDTTTKGASTTANQGVTVGTDNQNTNTTLVDLINALKTKA